MQCGEADHLEFHNANLWIVKEPKQSYLKSYINWLSFPNTINIAFLLLLLRVFHLEVNRQPSSPNSLYQARILEGGFFCLNSSAVALWTDGK